MTSIKSHPVDKLNLILALLTSLYFSLLTVISYEIINPNTFISIFTELLTIPSLLILLYVFLFGIVRLISGKYSVVHITGLLISTLTIGVLIYLTIVQSAG